MKEKKSLRAGGPTMIGALLKELLETKLPLRPISKELAIWEHWDRAVGIEIAKHAKPQGFKNGILFVHTEHAIWATELQYRSAQIRTKLNKAIGEDLIREIQFRTA